MATTSETRITATELSRNLSDILNRVRYAGERFVIERGGEVVGTLEPAARRATTFREVVAALGDLRMPGDGYADDLEAIQREQPPAEMAEWPS
ncbi:MAG: hypothetical protein AMXMBFR23_04550 [Chloroflexota bacterium]